MACVMSFVIVNYECLWRNFDERLDFLFVRNMATKIDENNPPVMTMLKGIPIDKRPMPFVLHGLFGATGGALGICVMHPADLIKTRMQILGTIGKKASIFEVLGQLLRTEGIKGMYRGLSSGIFRQYTYGITRFALFYEMLERYHKSYDKAPPLHTKLAIAGVSGMFGGFVGTPAEVALIRCTADGQMPPEQRRHYTHVFNALYRIAKEEGIGKWFSGVEATMTRAVIISASELASYTHARELIMPYLGDNLKLHFVSSMIAGFVATFSACPADIVKTRVQNSKVDIGQIQVLKDIIRNEGFITLWKGFLPFYLRVGPHAMLQFMTFEQFRILYFKFSDYQAEY